jgi:uncharacterized membrane protein YphA (DoxX/SURF4 family)
MINITSSAASSFKSRTFAYWVTTLVLATECVVRGVMGALRLPPFIGIMGHLGYPAYFMTILGVWYVLAGAALLIPRFPRLKEWAYAGLVFNYMGAAASRLAVGDGARLFDNVNYRNVKLEPIRTIVGAGVTHLKYCVLK